VNIGQKTVEGSDVTDIRDHGRHAEPRQVPGMTVLPASERDIGSDAPAVAAMPSDIVITVAEIVAAHADTRGDAVAVEDVDGSLTYRELRRLAAEIARQTLPVATSDAPVGILLPTSPAYVAAIVALLAKGIPYVPLDESFPVARNADIAARAGMQAIVVNATTAALTREIAPQLPQILVPDLADCPEDGTLDIAATPDSVAVIFYTSGSTGRPKGVYQSQRSILYEMLRHCARAGVRRDDRVALLYSPSVGGSTRNLYSSLLAGARLGVLDVRRLGLAAAAAALADWQTSVYHSVPSLFRSLFATESPVTNRLAASIRQVQLISDRVLASDVALYRRRFRPECRLCIDVAATETYSYASWYVPNDAVIDRSLVPVGYPRTDIRVSLVDDQDSLVPAGELGEVVVTGHALALGYWRDEELTRSRFSPSADMPGATVFRTGDMARLLSSGLLELVGRKDRQVKLNGNTVHLSEVEVLIGTCPDVADASVVARETGHERRLIAYVEAKLPGRLSTEAVARWCVKMLPGPMRPFDIVELEALPKLANGKPDFVELQKLDERRAAAAASSTPVAAAPVSASGVMQAVADGWAKYLDLAAFDAGLGFEASGGTSLKGLELLLFLEGRLGRKLGAGILDMKTRPTELMHRILFAGETFAGEKKEPADHDKPVFLIFPGVYGIDVAATEFAQNLEPHFTPDVVDYRWGGDEFDGTFNGRRFFATVLDRARQQGARRFWVIGVSYGSKLAAEAARLLMAAGITVEFIGSLDGVPHDRMLRRTRATQRAVPLGERVRAGIAQAGGVGPYAVNGLSRRLGLGLLRHRRFGLLRALLSGLQHAGLGRAAWDLRRAVIGAIRLQQFASIDLGRIDADFWLFLSAEECFDPAAYPRLGWDAIFRHVEVLKVDATHLDILKGEAGAMVVKTLTGLQATLSARSGHFQATPVAGGAGGLVAAVGSDI
jgi:fengycin family lipopeptide synthetase E